MANPIEIRNTLSQSTFPEDPPAALKPGHAHGRFLGFNQEYVRASLTLALLRRLPLDAFVETGTERGDTALLVAAQTGLRILTCDASLEASRRARRRLRRFSDRVRVYHGDSRDFLRDLDGKGGPLRPFFYLDAHNADDVPLVHELDIILANWPECLVMVDDFQVPGDPGFRFYAWGDEVQRLDYIAGALRRAPAPVTVFFPAYASALETGLKAGWVLLATDRLAEGVRGVAQDLVREQALPA